MSKFRFNNRCVVCVLNDYNEFIKSSKGSTQRYYVMLRDNFFKSLRHYTYGRGQFPKALHLCGEEHKSQWLSLRTIIIQNDNTRIKTMKKLISWAETQRQDAEMRLATIQMKLRAGAIPDDMEVIARAKWDVDHFTRLVAQRQRRLNELLKLKGRMTIK